MSEAPATNQTEPSGAMTPGQASRYWQVQLHLAERAVKDWHEYGDKVQKRYRADQETNSSKARSGRKRFAILYANTEMLKSSLYAKTPKPDVRRRFGDKNPVARTVAEILERSLSYCSDNTAHDRAYRAGVHDMCVPGRGIVWLVYEADTQQVEQIDPMTQQPAMGPDGQPVMADQIVNQDIREEHVYWRDFLWEPNRCWTDCNWVARRHRMTRQNLRDNGFKKADEVPMNWVADVGEKERREVSDEHKRAEVWEIWNKADKRRYWIVKGFAEALRIDDDPYELEGFWPLAEPLSAILGTDSYIPVPFYSQYEDQAEDLDEITGRISNLVKALKRRGIYDASIPELKRLANAGDNQFIGVPGDKYQLAVQAGGLEKAFQSEDVSKIAEVLVGLHDQRDRLIRSIYEVSGMSDIIRGESDPNETATAQNIKAQVGSMRLKDTQKSVQTWVRDSYRIKAELIAQNFTPEKLAAITGMNPQDENFQQAIQVMRSDEMRNYQVDIETDSTVFEDAEAEKTARVELLTAMGGFAQQWLPVVQVAPEMIKLIGEMMSFGVRGFKVGRSLEDTIEETMQAIQQRMLQQQQNPPPDPEMEKAKMEMQQSQEEHQQNMQAKQVDQQLKVADQQLQQQAQAQDLAFKREEHAMDMQFEREKAGMEMGLKQIEGQMSLEQSQQMNEQKLAAAKAMAKAKPKPAGANGRAH